MAASEANLRDQLLQYAQALEPSGLSPGKSGNLSTRWQDGCLITPSAIAYTELTAEAMVALRADGEPLPNQSYKPSSEWRFHCDLYRARPDIQAIVHAHPPASTALACTGRAIPAFHYMVAIAGGKRIPIADYGLFGSAELSQNILQAMGPLQACLLANHGLITAGDGLSSAFNLALEVETLADQYSRALQLGDVRELSDEQMQAVLQKFRHYGQRS